MRLLSVTDYHRLIAADLLGVDDRVELLEGFLVYKMAHSSACQSVLDGITELLRDIVPAGWRVRGQSAITLTDSEPEPDFVVVPGTAFTYRQRHPGPADVAIVGEVSDTTLASDRQDKGRIYARAALPIYWIVNIPDAIVEVYSDPTGPDAAPRYRQRRDYGATEEILVLLGGITVGKLRVADLQL